MSSERLYYSDSFLTAFRAAVVEARELAAVDGEAAWRIALDRTAFYPTSGGQPFDTGMLRATAQGGGMVEVAVEQVEEDGDGVVWHYARQPLAAGAHVEGSVDWGRRFDHMQQHTGQHLLSAVFLRELKAPTVSFHLGESSCTIDIACAPPAQHSLERVERIVNEVIAEDLAVTTRFVSRDEAEAMLAAGEVRKLPEREGAIRMIEIAECDLNACGGTHVRSTGQIGGMLLRKLEKLTRGVRVEFVCGMRAVRAARADAGIVGETAALLSVGAAELPGAVARLLAEGKSGQKERQRLREELAALEGARLAQEAPAGDGLRVLERAWKDKDGDFVRMLASRAVAATQRTAVIFAAEDADPVRVFVARSKDLSFDCGRILKEALSKLGLRGGGSADLAQGDVPAEKLAELRAAVAAAMREG